MAGQITAQPGGSWSPTSIPLKLNAPTSSVFAVAAMSRASESEGDDDFGAVVANAG